MSSNRIYRTSEGHHVKEGDPRAAFLAYGEGDDVPAEVARELEREKPRKPGRPPKPKD